MSNRRERRAQARNKATGVVDHDVPLTQPTRDTPSNRTLLDIANERQLLSRNSQADASITSTRINPDGSLLNPETIEEQSETAESPYLDIGLYTITLTLLHYTLTVLVHHQYATIPPSLLDLFYDSTIASPTPALLLILVTILHPRSANIATQLLFAILSIIAGAWLVYASNAEPYLAVMKKAPPLGTMWVWAVVEMKWEWALGCVGFVVSWGWWRGYSIR